MTYSSPSRTARVWMPATSEPASGSVMPRQRIFSPLIAGTTHRRFCSSVPNARIGGIAMSVCTATPMASLPEFACTISSAGPRAEASWPPCEPQRRVVVPPLAAVLLGLVEAEEAELAHAAEHPVGERRLLPLLGVRRELADRERADRLAQLLVLVAEDEVPALGGVVGSGDPGGGHAGKVVQGRAEVNSRTSYFPRSTQPYGTVSEGASAAPSHLVCH